MTDVDDNVAWGAAEYNQELMNIGKKIGEAFASINRNNVDSSVYELLIDITKFISHQVRFNDKCNEKIMEEARDARQEARKATECVEVVSNSLKEVSEKYYSSNVKAVKEGWAEEVKRSSKTTKVFGIDIKEKVEGYHALKKAGIESMFNSCDTEEALKGELNRNTTVRVLGRASQFRDGKNTAPIIIESDCMMKKINVEKVLKEQIPNVVIAYHWPARLVKPIKQMRDAYTAAGTVKVKDCMVDLANCDIRIRPDDGGTHLTIHYRERIEGKECKFQHLETIPTPIAGSELARHKINEKPISSTLSCVKFDFGKL